MKNVVFIGLLAVAAAPSQAAQGLESIASAQSAQTLVTFPDDGVDVAQQRWFWFFGGRLCAGQIVRLPGETQCL